MKRELELSPKAMWKVWVPLVVFVVYSRSPERAAYGSHVETYWRHSWFWGWRASVVASAVVRVSSIWWLIPVLMLISPSASGR